MPYDIEPKFIFEYPQRFVLTDDNNIALIGRGFRYKGTTFKIKSIEGYGYTNGSILVKCTDGLDSIKYLISYETTFKKSSGISFKELSEIDFRKIKESYKWTDLDQKKAQQLFRRKLSLFAGALVSLILLLWQLFFKGRMK